MASFTSLLASHVDFRLPGREGLEDLFFNLDIDAAASNPSLSEAHVDSVVSGPSGRDGDNERLYDALFHHCLSERQRTLFFSQRRHADMLCAFLRYQNVSAKDITTLRSLDTTHSIDETLAYGPARYEIDQREDFIAILSKAGAAAQIHWLIKCGVGSFPNEARRWVGELETSSLVYRGSGADVDDLLADLVEARPDLIEFLAVSALDAARLAVARSRHCTELATQLALLELSGARPGYRSDVWSIRNELMAIALTSNPRCHLQVLDMLDEYITSKTRAVSNLRTAVQRRRSQYHSHPTVSEPYEKVRQLSTITWLVDRCATKGRASRGRSYDARVLLGNPRLTSTQRVALKEAAVVTAKEDTSFERWGAPVVQEQRLDVCDGKCRSTETPCGKAKCAAYARYDWAAADPETTGSLIESMSLGAEWCQSSPLAAWLVDQLGEDPAVYTTFLMLGAAWHGTLGALVETTLALHRGEKAEGVLRH